MAIELKMPALSPTMEEGTLAKWLVKEGDTVLFELLDGEARITSRQAQLQRARALFRRYVPADAPSPADELIAERRAEAARE